MRESAGAHIRSASARRQHAAPDRRGPSGWAGFREGGAPGVPGQPGGAARRHVARNRDCGFAIAGFAGCEAGGLPGRGNSGITGRSDAAPGSGVADARLRDMSRRCVALRAMRAGRPRTREGSSGITGRGRTWARRPVPLGAPASSPARAKRARGHCESRRARGEPATDGCANGNGSARAAAGRRAVIDDAGEDAGGPREIGGAGSGHAHASRIAPSGFRERPRAEALLAGGAACADEPAGASGSPPH